MEWLFLASFLMTVIVAHYLRGTVRHRGVPWICRVSFLTSVALMAPVWCWLYLIHRVALPDSLISTVGAFVGGVITTTLSTGFVENNAPPPPGIRDKVIAHHLYDALHYPPEPRLKRMLDVSLAALLVTVTLPLWFLIAFILWIEEPGPIFFTKNSVGRGGVTFRQLKFRSMRYDAERLTGPVASFAGDPRTLRFGRWLRRWHFDELPELLNVLAGTMSLVGPRPLRTVLVQQYLEEIPRFAERHTVKPGIACIAQIEKCQMPPAERLRKDQAYIRAMSLALDVRLLCRAVSTTVRGTRYGALATRPLPNRSTAGLTSTQERAGG
jgi:lipopolysaccharide/colanic/teichoic acid biosynthesis glycosyltransferase